MKVSDIYTILVDQDLIVSRSIFEKYKTDFDEYKKSILKKGSSIHLKTVYDFDFLFNKSHLQRIGLLFIEKKFSELEINFLVDNILASISRYESETLMENLENFTDPEVNGHLSEYVNEILKHDNR